LFGIGAGAPSVGLDIGTGHIRAAQVAMTGAGPVLNSYGLVGVPMGAVVEGEIIDVETTSMAIRELWRSFSIRNKNVVIGVSNQKVVVRLIDLPYMEKLELQGAIQYQAQDYIPIPVEDAVLDFNIIGDYMTPTDEHMMEVLLVAAQRDMVSSAVAAVEGAGLKLQRIDVTPFAIVRALMGVSQAVLPSEGEGEGDATGVIHVSSGITNIAVLEKGIPRFTRVSSVNGNEFTRAISNVLNVSFDDAEDLKMRLGLPDPTQTTAREVPEGMDPKVAEVAQDALEREVNKFIAEVRRSLDYYLTQTAQIRTIRKILLAGSGAQLTNLASYLEKGLQAEVFLSDPLARLQVAPAAAQLATQDRMGCAAAVGLALGGTSQ
jgi:type IV pilus assembly protein PilM